MLPFAAIGLLMLIALALPLLSAGWLLGTRTAVQRAADAAALAGAGQAVLQRQVDARGTTYCESLAVDPVAGPTAAADYWTENTSAIPGLATTDFVALPHGPDLTVQATVSAPPGGLLLLGQTSVTWTVTAEAEVQRPAAVPSC